MVKAELKPCPFCGGKPDIHPGGFVECTEGCGAAVGDGGADSRAAQAAIAAWNRRTSPTEGGDVAGAVRELTERLDDYAADANDAAESGERSDDWVIEISPDTARVALTALSRPTGGDVAGAVAEAETSWETIWRQREPTRLKSSRFRADISDFIRRTGEGERFVIEHYDREVAFLTAIEDWRRLTAGLRPSALSRSTGDGEAEPIPMVLFCPKCGAQHIDEPEFVPDPGGGDHDTAMFVAGERAKAWSNPPHRSHLCLSCGCTWRPADVPTTGVEAITTIGKSDTFNGFSSVPARPTGGEIAGLMIGRAEIAHAIADGFSHGNEHYEDATEAQRARYDMAADMVLEALAASPSRTEAEEVERLRAAVARVLATEEARKAFHYLDRGIGTKTPDGEAWLAIRAALNGEKG